MNIRKKLKYPPYYNICLKNQETAIQTRFNDSGVAWFYILDPDTQKFKLPRTQWNFVGLRDNVGGYVAESLPNITGDIGYGISNDSKYQPSGAFYGQQKRIQTVCSC